MVSAVVACFALALYGWGRVAERLLRVRWPWPMAVCLGLAPTVFLGGIVNLLHVAFAATLDAIFVTGLALGAVALVRANRTSRKRRGESRLWLRASPGALLILAAFLFQAIALTPPAAFNIHDDFETYLPLPLRMLQTGSVDGGPFNYVGINTLGAQGFLQGFVAAHWPVAYVDSVDALFGLALVGTMILVASLRAGAPVWLAALAIALLIAINPQYVNVSTLYIGSALLVFLMFLPLGLRAGDAPLAPFSPAAGVVTGLIYATLIALKTTFALLIVAHFAVTSAAMLLATKRATEWLRWSLCVAASGCCLLLPWFLVHVYKLVPTLLARLPGAGPSQAVLSGATEGGPGLVSTMPIFYGFGTGFAHYTALALLSLLCAGVLGWRAAAGESRARSLHGAAACLTLPVFYLVHMSVVGGLIGAETALRYAVPMLVGIAPAGIVLAGSPVNADALRPAERAALAWARAVLVAIPAACLIWVFMGSLADRARQAWSDGNALAFLPYQPPGAAQAYLSYNRRMLESYSRDYIRGIQQLVPAGAPILSFVTVSIHYDFARNPILDVDAGGLGGAWLDFPFEGGVDEARRDLAERGVHYVLWERDGFAVLTPALAEQANFSNSVDRRRSLKHRAFWRTLEGLSKEAEILFDDGEHRLNRIR